MPKKPVDKSFGKRLTLLRKQRGLTMRELAKNLGVSLRSIFYYEKQSKQPPSHLLARMSKELDVTVEQLLGFKPIKKKVDPEQVALWKKFKQVLTLPKTDQRALFHYLSALLTKNRKRS